MIKLNKKHEYSLGKKKFQSVTTFIHKFFEPFDSRGIAKKLASFPVNRARKMGVRYWLKKWQFSRTEGTLIHKQIDDYILNNKYPTHLKALSAVRFLEEYYKDEPITSERMVYSTELGLAGTIDCLVHTKDGIVLLDWKSNDKITMQGYKGKKGILPPTKNIDDANYWHYCLQLNIYAYIISKYYNEPVISMKLIHLGDSEYIIYDIPAMFDVIGEMLEYKEE